MADLANNELVEVFAVCAFLGISVRLSLFKTLTDGTEPEASCVVDRFSPRRS